jgi:hypothetical protein
MNASAMTIRLAEPGDLAAIRDLLVETWHDTYDALIGPAKVTEITDRWHSLENLARQLALPETSFLVAEQAGDIVGACLRRRPASAGTLPYAPLCAPRPPAKRRRRAPARGGHRQPSGGRRDPA